MALLIRDDISRLSRTAEQLRSVRKQLQEREKLLAEDDKAKELIQAAKALTTKLDELEGKLHNPKAKVSYDILAQEGGAQLYSQLAWLFELVKESDGGPTEGLRKVYKEQRRLLNKYIAAWEKLVKDDVARLNAQAKKLDLPGVFVPAVKPGQEGHPAPHKRR